MLTFIFVAVRVEVEFSIFGLNAAVEESECKCNGRNGSVQNYRIRKPATAQPVLRNNKNTKSNNSLTHTHTHQDPHIIISHLEIAQNG